MNSLIILVLTALALLGKFGGCHVAGRFDDYQDDRDDISFDIDDFNKDLDIRRRSTPSEIQADVYEPELWIVYDYVNSAHFNFDLGKVTRYLTLFMHAVNNRFATIKQFNVRFRIAKITIITSKDQQPYIENCYIPGRNELNAPLLGEAFSKWIKDNSDSDPKNRGFDVAVLFTGIGLLNPCKNPKNNDFCPARGVAPVAGACKPERGIGIGSFVIIEDAECAFREVIPATHEFGHLLGARHDGSGDAKDCPLSDFHIMGGGKGMGVKHMLFFSKCSIQLIKKYISSPDAACLKTRNAKTNIPIATENIGDVYTMDQQCQLFKGPKGFANNAEASACHALYCSWPTQDGGTDYDPNPRAAGDNSPCEDGKGRCKDGDCIKFS